MEHDRRNLFYRLWLWVPACAGTTARELRRNSRSSSRTRAITLSQSPSAGWRNKRAVGYQGESSRSSIQRQSGQNGNRIQVGRPMRAGEMHHRGVDRDHQVDQRGDRGGVVEIFELVADMGEPRRAREQLGILRRATRAGCSRSLRARQQTAAPAATARASGCGRWRARRCRPRRARCAATAVPRCARAIWRCAPRPPRDKECRPGCSRARSSSARGRLPTGQCTSKSGSGSPRATTLGDAFDPRQQARQLRLHFEHDLGAAARQAAAHSAQSGWCRRAPARHAAGWSCARADIRRARAACRGGGAAACRCAASAIRISQSRADSRRASSSASPSLWWASALSLSTRQHLTEIGERFADGDCRPAARCRD